MKKLGVKLLILICMADSLVCKAQSNVYKTTFNSRKQIEVMILPTLVFNSLSLGMSRSISEKREQAITLSAQALFFGEPPYYASVAGRYNYNISLNENCNHRAYLPLWCGVRYFVGSGGGEQDSRAFQILLYSIGTGIGLKYQFKNHHSIRFELGLGVSIYTESEKGESLNDFKYNNKYPFVPALRGGVKYLIPFGRERKQN